MCRNGRHFLPLGELGEVVAKKKKQKKNGGFLESSGEMWILRAILGHTELIKRKQYENEPDSQRVSEDFIKKN